MNKHELYERTAPATGMRRPEKQVVFVYGGHIEDFGTWGIDDNGCLHINGNGDMPDWFWCSTCPPWHTYKESILTCRISNNVTSIGNYAFNYCTSLTCITIPNSVTSIGKGAFYRCTSLTCITIPDSVTSIGDEVFEWCTSLTNINIPKNVTELGQEIFLECTALKKVTMPACFNRVFFIKHYLLGDTLPVTFKSYFGIPKWKVTFY